MNNREKYDVALMEGTLSPKRIAKKRFRAFVEAVSEIAPRELVEAVASAHRALFEYREGVTREGVRFRTGLGATDPRKTNRWSEKTRFNGNDAVARNASLQPPTGANVIAWQKFNPRGNAADKHYEQIEMNRSRQKIDPRGYEARVNMHANDAWDNVPPPPPQVEPPTPVRQPEPKVEPPKVEPPKVECPPVCPEPKKVTEAPVKTQALQKPEKKAPAPQYKWKDSDFQEIRGEQCNPKYPYVVNLVSYSSNNKKTAAYQAKHEFDEGVKGVYIYQYDGQAHNSSRKDVWRVRIGFFKSRAAARTYVIKHVKDRDQFKWWIARCDAENASGDKMKPNTFQLAENIKDSDCIDESSSKKPTEQKTVNTPQKPTEDNKAQQGNAKETEHKNILDYAKEE